MINKFKSLLCGSAVFFLLNSYAALAQDIDKKIQLSFSTGRQQEDFRWAIAGNSSGTSPNVLSELKWKNVSGENFSASLSWNVWKKFVLMAACGRLSVQSGSVNDMDYNGDNRTNPIYAGNFSDNKGYTDAWSVGAGYKLISNGLFSLTPYAGYGVNRQALYLVDLTGQFPDLNSSYQAKWRGVFLKINSSLKITRALKLAAALTYNQVNYTANGDWNLISQFRHPVSYAHVAKGYGISPEAHLIYVIVPNVAVSLGYNYFSWQTGNGNDMLYLESGGVDKTRLDGVSRNGSMIEAGLIIGM